MRILQISALDEKGGAAQIARALHQGYLARGHDAWMAVGKRQTRDPRVLEIPAVPDPGRRSFPANVLLAAARRTKAAALRKALLYLACPPRPFDLAAGTAQFYHPGSEEVPDLLPAPPDVLHLHNLHGRYFDLRALPPLSARFPTFVTLHDAWLLSGHCAHSFDCDRWTTGCGRCPDLGIYPAMRRDATAWAWRVKRDTFARSGLHVITPCRWLMDRVERSMLAPAVREARVIPNGVDLSIFAPGDRLAARAQLGIPPTDRVVLFAAAGIRASEFKDYRTLREAVGRAAERLPGEPLHFIALGEDGPPEQLGRASIRFVPYARDRATVAAHYRAADLYVHAARADTFPNTVVEALACGTPVVATAVGGIPEQVRPLAEADAAGADATGALVPMGDAEAMARAIVRLLADDALRLRLAGNAARDARARFDADLQLQRHLTWQEEAIAAWRGGGGLVSSGPR